MDSAGTASKARVISPCEPTTA